MGNAQQVLVAIFQAIEKSEGKSSLRRAVHATRSLGYEFRTKDACEWLAPFLSALENRAQNGRFPNRETGRETVGKRVLRTTGNDLEKGREPARAVKVSLIKANTVPSERRTPPKRSRRVKQQALELGAAAPPEIDYDKSRFCLPESLPEHFPDPVDELREIAIVFVRVFANVKNAEKLAENARKYTDTLAVFRQRGVTVSASWQAFIDAVRAQDWRPLFGAQSKKALAYLASTRRPFSASGPRVDSCGCTLPAGVFMPRIEKGETAHWDGDEWLFGSASDPK